MSSGRSWHALWGAVLVLSSAACARARVPRVGDAPPALADTEAESKYQSLMEQHSGRANVYDGVDTRAFIAATVETPSFVAARSDRRSAFRMLDAVATEVERSSELRALAGVWAVTFGVHSNESRVNDFDRPDSSWQVQLRVGTQQLRPLKVERLGRPTPELKALYPYLDTFWVAYRAHFPRLDVAEGAVAFLVAGPLGAAELPMAARFPSGGAP